MSIKSLQCGVVSFVALVAAEASAQVPISPDQFEVTYYITDEAGERVRPMDDGDEYFVNQARCECGQAIQAEVRAEPADVDPTRIIVAMIGTMCGLAEETPGQFRRCVELAEQTYNGYVQGRVANVHPVWLANGVEIGSDSRDPATAVAAGSCVGAQGQGEPWLCAQTDPIAGCQAEEFFYSDSAGGIRFDFLKPVMEPRDVTVEPYAGGALVSWEIDSAGDINGYRVLCEEVSTGAPPRVDFAAPGVTDASDGTHYYTAYNLCGGEPFSTVKMAPLAGDGVCGDGVRDPGEQCDDGADGDDGMCTQQCTLAVSEALYGLDWGLMCSAHVAFNETSAVVEGLEDGKTYNVVLVAHDAFGNPKVVSPVLRVTPDASLPSLGSEDGCGCRSESSAGGLLLLVALPLLRRRRR